MALHLAAAQWAGCAVPGSACQAAAHFQSARGWRSALRHLIHPPPAWALGSFAPLPQSCLLTQRVGSIALRNSTSHTSSWPTYDESSLVRSLLLLIKAGAMPVHQILTRIAP